MSADLIVRCSSIGKLMAKPDNAELDPIYRTEELAGIIAKTKRTEEEKSVLAEAQRKSLSAGGKTHVRELVREAIYGFEPAEIETRPILKGRAVEAECIALLAKLTGRPLVKNTERRNNGLISGECDIFDAPLRHGRDVKAPYSMETMPIVLADCYDSGYFHQMQGYEILWDAETWSVDYVLVNTPEEFVGFEPAHLHFVDHIAEAHRWTTWTVQRDRALESLIVDKVLAARRYYRQVINEFDCTHGGSVPEVPPTAPAIKLQPTNHLGALGAAVLADLDF
ncbi:MAG: hypothetical protein EOP35_01665 [Rubrivivax sp.]|nr:MAG: hypothetical protein EOP35_01665 [Rubrivivax sp.]